MLDYLRSEDFIMIDEAYDHVEMDSVHVLMQSDHHPKFALTAWTWTYGQKEVLYLDLGHGSLGMPLGHGPVPYQIKSFKSLLNRGILRAARRL